MLNGSDESIVRRESFALATLICMSVFGGLLLWLLPKAGLSSWWAAIPAGIAIISFFLMVVLQCEQQARADAGVGRLKSSQPEIRTRKEIERELDDALGLD